MNTNGHRQHGCYAVSVAWKLWTQTVITSMVIMLWVLPESYEQKLMVITNMVIMLWVLPESYEHKWSPLAWLVMPSFGVLSESCTHKRSPLEWLVMLYFGFCLKAVHTKGHQGIVVILRCDVICHDIIYNTQFTALALRAFEVWSLPVYSTPS